MTEASLCPAYATRNIVLFLSIWESSSVAHLVEHSPNVNKTLGSIPQHHKTTGRGKQEDQRFMVLYLWIHKKSEASLEYIRVFQNKNLSVCIYINTHK